MTLDEPARVVVGMVRAVTALEVELHLQRRQSQEVLERDEVGAAAKRAELHLESFGPAAASLWRLTHPLVSTPPVVDRSGAVEVRHITRDLHEKIAERRSASAIKAAAHLQVRVDVDDGLLT